MNTLNTNLDEVSKKLAPVDISFAFTDEFSIVSGRYKCQVKNNRVCLYMHVLRNSNMSAGGIYGIGNIYSSYSVYKPKIQMQIPCVIDDGSSKPGTGIGIITIQTDGVINLTPLTSGTTWRRATISIEWDV